jgi:hypothetical protein
MFIQVLSAVCVALFPPIICYFMIQPIRLEDVQNIRDGKSLTGRHTRLSQHLDTVSHAADLENQEGSETEEEWEYDVDGDETSSSDSQSGVLERVTSRARRSSFFA